MSRLAVLPDRETAHPSGDGRKFVVRPSLMGTRHDYEAQQDYFRIQTERECKESALARLDALQRRFTILRGALVVTAAIAGWAITEVVRLRLH